jgi:hypothetical protein
VLTDNRHGLVVNVQASSADGYAELDVAERMLSDVARPNVRITVAADKGYDTRGFVNACRTMNVTPQVAQNIKRTGGIAIDGLTTRHLLRGQPAQAQMDRAVPRLGHDDQPDPPGPWCRGWRKSIICWP